MQERAHALHHAREERDLVEGEVGERASQLADARASVAVPVEEVAKDVLAGLRVVQRVSVLHELERHLLAELLVAFAQLDEGLAEALEQRADALHRHRGVDLRAGRELRLAGEALDPLLRVDFAEGGAAHAERVDELAELRLLRELGELLAEAEDHALALRAGQALELGAQGLERLAPRAPVLLVIR